MSIVRGMCLPKRVRATGKGWRECAASGFVREADDVVEDVRQGLVAREFADITPGFGTYHPQDVRQDGPYDDPSPIELAQPISRYPISKADLNISDAEVERSVREGGPPRPGY